MLPCATDATSWCLLTAATVMKIKSGDKKGSGVYAVSALTYLGVKICIGKARNKPRPNLLLHAPYIFAS